MGEFISNNLVGNVIHSDQALYEHFYRLAQRSFQQEQTFYKKLGIDQMKDIPKTVEETVTFLTDQTKFMNYQTTLEDSLYGKDTHFIKYFYDKDFIGYLSGKAISASSVLNNLEQDLASYALAMSDDKYDKADATVVDGDLELDKVIKIFYEVGGISDFIEIKPKDLALRFKGKKKISSGDIQKNIATIIQEQKNIKGRIAFKSRKELSELLQALTLYISNENKILGQVTKKNKGYYITRGFEFGIEKDTPSLGEVLFGTYGNPNPLKEDDGLIKSNAQITYTGLLNDGKKSVAKDIITALNITLIERDIITDKSEKEINDITQELVIALVEGMSKGKANVSVKEQGGKRAANKRVQSDSGKKEMFELNFNNPKIDDIIDNKKYRIELRGGADIFATLFSDKFKTEFQKLLQDEEQVSSQGKNLICEIPIIREDKNLFFNQLNNSVSADDYSSASIKKNINKEEFQKQLKIDAQAVAKGFSTVITSVIRTMEGKNSAKEWSDSKNFEQWWGVEGENSMADALINLIQKNPGQIYEILTKKDTKQIAGMIGETIFGAIVMRKMQSSSDSIVQMLGQTAHGNGEAAVDLKMLNIDMLNEAKQSGPLFLNGMLQVENLEKQRLSSVGFQLKNYTSAKGDKEILYDTDNKLLSDTQTMKRYLESSFLNEIQNYLNKENQIFFKGKNQEELTTDQKDKLIEIGNILTYHIPYFMRFDEAQMDSDNFGIEQNNFYIINFHFVPSSILFYLMGQVIEKQKSIQGRQGSSLYNEYFYFSSYETGTERKARHEAGEKKQSNRNFLSSYWQFREFDFKNSSYNNLISWHNEKLAINFTGIKVNFGKAFDEVVQKMT